MSLNNDEKKLEERVAELEREMSKLRRDMSSKVDEMEDLNKRLFKQIQELSNCALCREA